MIRPVRAMRMVARDRHDVLTYLGLGALFAGLWGQWGPWIALTGVGAVLTAFAWRGLR